MAEAGILNLLQTVSPAAPPAAPEPDFSASATPEDGSAFAGFLRDFLGAARNAEAVAAGEALPAGEASTVVPAPLDVPLDATGQEAAERIAILVADGSLDPAQLEELTDEEWSELAAWVLALPAELFPVVDEAPPSGGIELGFGLEEAGEAMLQMERLLHRLDTALQDGEMPARHTLFDQVMGLENLGDTELEDLAREVLKAVQAAAGETAAEDSARGSLAVSLENLVDNVPQEDLRRALLTALARLQQGGEEGVRLPEAARQLIESAPPAGLNSLAERLVELAVSDESGDANALRELDPGRMLREHLLQLAAAREVTDPSAGDGEMKLPPSAGLEKLTAAVMHEGEAAAAAEGKNGAGAALAEAQALVVEGEDSAPVTEAGEPAARAKLLAAGSETTDEDGEQSSGEKDKPATQSPRAATAGASEQDGEAPAKAETNAETGKPEAAVETKPAAGEPQAARKEELPQPAKSRPGETTPVSEKESFGEELAAKTKTEEAPSTIGANGVKTQAQPVDLPETVPVTSIKLEIAPAQPQESAPAPQQAPGEKMLENIERVEQVMRMSLQRGGRSLSLRLDPPELGRVTVRLTMRQGEVVATLRTETNQARDMLLTGGDQLRRNLEVQGVKLGNFDVFSNEDDGGATENGYDWDRGGMHDAEEGFSGDVDGREGDGEATSLTAAEEEDETAPAAPRGRGGLNVVA